MTLPPPAPEKWKRYSHHGNSGARLQDMMLPTRRSIYLEFVEHARLLLIAVRLHYRTNASGFNTLRFIASHAVTGLWDSHLLAGQARVGTDQLALCLH